MFGFLYRLLINYKKDIWVLYLSQTSYLKIRFLFFVFLAFTSRFYVVVVIWCFLAFDFCRFCVVIRFFYPATTANELSLRRISIPDLIHYIIILILEKEPVFPFSMFSAKQGNYWYHFYNAFGAFLEAISHSIFCCICIFFAKSLFF